MIQQRSTIPDRYRWEPTAVYRTNEAFDQEYETATTLLENLRTDLAEPPADAATAVTVFERFERLCAARTRLELGAEIRQTIDLTDEEGARRQDEVRRLSSEITTLTTDLRRYVREHADRLETFRDEDDALASPGHEDDTLAPFDRFCENVLAAPTGDPELRRCFDAFGDVLDATDRILLAIGDEDFEPPTVVTPDGERETVTWARRIQLLKHPDRTFRRRVYEVFYGALEEDANAIATTWIEKLRSHARQAEALGYDSIRHRALSKASYPETGIHLEFPVEAHDTLCETVTDELEPYHRLARLRRDHVARDVIAREDGASVDDLSDTSPSVELRPWDRMVPLTTLPEPTIPYDEARAHVLEAVEPLGRDYRDRLERFLDDRRVDVYHTEDAREVTYCLSASGEGAYVSLCYDGGVRSVFALAHELGHAMETELRGEIRRPLYETTPRPVEEVPSMLHEFLLADHLLAVGDPPLREHVRNRLLTVVAGNVYGAVRNARFTRQACRAIEEDGTLTRSRLDDVNADLHATFHPEIEPDDHWERSWLARAHVREPYHHYQYALGVTGAIAVTDALDVGSLSTDAYREFLEFGGTKPAIDQFAHLGVDLETPTPYRRAADRLDGLCDRVDGEIDRVEGSID